MFGCEDSDKIALCCKILYFTPGSEYELTHINKADLHNLQTDFYSIDFSADWRLVWNTNYLQPGLVIFSIDNNLYNGFGDTSFVTSTIHNLCNLYFKLRSPGANVLKNLETSF